MNGTKACPHCAEEIQGAAKVCKHCGRDVGFKFQPPGCFGSLVILVIGIVALGYCAPTTPRSTTDPNWNPQTSPSRLLRLVKRYLRDPESASVTVAGNGCGYVNSKNGFGGMTGDTPFIVYEDDTVIFQETAPRRFSSEWKKRC